MMNSHVDNWERHWSEYSDVTDLEPARKWRRSLVLEKILSGDPTSVLDLSSGKGDLLLELSTRSEKIRLGATDYSSVALKLLRLKNKDIQSVQADLNFSLKTESQNYLLLRGPWDVVVCCEVLEHLDKPEMALQSVKELTRPGSRLIITVPGGPIADVDRAFGHRRHYQKKDLRNFLESEGFIVDRIQACGFPFFNIYRFGLVVMGKSVLDTINKMNVAKPSFAKVVTSRIVGSLFRLNLNKLPLGWQLICECRVA
jgi:SAM-dependent methyltransferase